jgi:cytochrome c553
VKPFIRLLVVVAGVALIAIGVGLAQAQEASPATNYLMFCATCHGKDGKGDGPSAASLNPRPRDFADCKVMTKISDDTIFRAIKFGGASVGVSNQMPSWAAGLSDHDIHGLVGYVRHFCPK